MTAIENIGTDLARLEGGELSTDEVLLLIDRVEELIRRAKDWQDKAEAGLLAIVLRDGPITAGPKKYWAGHDKTVKCRDPHAVLMFLLTCDLDAAMGCLSSNAFKYGAFRKLVDDMGCPEKFDEHFETTVIDKLESGEKLPKKLQVTDARFTR